MLWLVGLASPSVELLVKTQASRFRLNLKHDVFGLEAGSLCCYLHSYYLGCFMFSVFFNDD